MPRVPVLDSPSILPVQAPVVEQSAPTPRSFGGQVGAEADATAKEIFNLGWSAYHRAAETFSQSKQNEFQEQALALRDQYHTLYNKDAIDRHTQFTGDLEKLRTKIGEGITSEYGQSLYNSNSMRNARLVQESIDSHFATQNRSYQEITYKDAQALDSKGLAALAANDTLSPAGVDEKVASIYNRAKGWATANGLPEADADQHAKVAVGAAMDGYFDVLTDRHTKRTPGEISSEYARWNTQGYLSKQVQDKVQASSVAATARTGVQAIFDGTPRLVNDPKFDGSPDPDGQPDLGAIQQKLSAYVKAHPEQEEVAQHEYNNLRSQVEGAFTQEVKHRVDRVVALARDEAQRTGTFHVDPTSRDYRWLLRNQSTALDPVVRSEYKTASKADTDAHNMNAVKFKADLIALSAQDPDKFSKLTEADLFKMQDDQNAYKGGFSPKYRLDEAGKVLKELQVHQQKGDTAWIEKNVVSYLKDNIYTNKDEALKSRSGVLHDEISTSLQEALKAGTVKRDDWKSLNDFLKSETAKVGQKEIFGAKVGGDYKAALDAAARRAIPPAQPVKVPQAPSPATPAARKTPQLLIIDGRQWDNANKVWVK